MATMKYEWISSAGDDLGESKLHRAMQRPQGPKWINKPQYSGAPDEQHHKEGNNTPTHLSLRTSDALRATRHSGTQPAAVQAPVKRPRV